MKKKNTNKRRTIFIILFIVIMIPLLILSRILKHRHVPIERPVGKIGFHDASSDQNGLLLPWTTWEDAL